MAPVSLPARVPVLIAGGGPVGLACAALLPLHSSYGPHREALFGH